MMHYDDDAITRFAHDEQTPGYAEFREHAKDCAACEQWFDIAREVETALRDKATWQAAQAFGRPVAPPAWLADREAARARERADAEVQLEPLLASPAVFKKAAVESTEAFHNPATVRALTDAAEALRTGQPQFALAVASAAVAIGDNLILHGAGISRSLVGQALCQRAIALGTVSRYREAEDAVTRAEREFDADPTSTPYDAAVVALIRAVIYVETERLDAAEQHARKASAIFHEYGDGTRLLRALLIEGIAAYFRKDYGRGVVVLERLVNEARQRKNRRTLAHALVNAGLCHAGCRNWSTAEAYYFEALVLWDEIGDETERTRAEWSLALVMLNTQRIEASVEPLRKVWRRFEALGVVNDAAIARLDLAEALLATGQPAEVPRLLDGLALTFTSAGMMHNARIAIAYLAEAAAAAGVTPQLIPHLRHVRGYLDALPTNPSRPFLRPS